MNNFYTDEIYDAIKKTKKGEIPDNLFSILYSLGRDAQNDEEYDYSFDMLTSISNHTSVNVLSIVILSYSLLAVIYGRLDRNIVEPIILKVWKIAKGEDRERVTVAVEDINFALNWGLVLQ